jgi:hypothetical protein
LDNVGGKVFSRSTLHVYSYRIVAESKLLAPGAGREVDHWLFFKGVEWEDLDDFPPQELYFVVRDPV